MLIYKITNNVNGKCYIGQTVKTGQERWKEHQYHAFGTHENDQNKVLYKAIRKYGLENFSFEVIQDNIQDYQKLDGAEIYWINYYDSFVNGYNSTFGGQKYHMVLPHDEIIKDYLKTRSARKTAKKFGIHNNTVDDILNSNGIPRFSFRQSAGQRIVISKDDFSKEFDSVVDCAQWFVENNICKTKKVESVRTSLKQCRRENKKYYGYDIKNFEE